MPAAPQHKINPESEPDVLVACVGNGLAGDDAVGQVVYERLKREHLTGTPRILHLGLGGLSLIDHLKRQKLLVVVDAVRLGGTAGDIHVLESDRLPAAGAQAVSVHGIGLLETLSIANRLYPELAPARTVLIGIEGKEFTQLGAPLSEEVAAAVSGAVEEVKRQIERLTPVESEA